MERYRLQRTINEISGILQLGAIPDVTDSIGKSFSPLGRIPWGKGRRIDGRRGCGILPACNYQLPRRFPNRHITDTLCFPGFDGRGMDSPGNLCRRYDIHRR